MMTVVNRRQEIRVRGRNPPQTVGLSVPHRRGCIGGVWFRSVHGAHPRTFCGAGHRPPTNGALPGRPLPGKGTAVTAASADSPPVSW
jgi:hypothetical protein